MEIISELNTELSESHYPGADSVFQNTNQNKVIIMYVGERNASQV